MHPGQKNPIESDCLPNDDAGIAALAETLTALQAKGMGLGIVTNGRVRGQHTTIAQLGSRPYLSAVVISEAVQIEKPNPRIFARALAEVGCPASLSPQGLSKAPSAVARVLSTPPGHSVANVCPRVDISPPRRMALAHDAQHERFR